MWLSTHHSAGSVRSRTHAYCPLLQRLNCSTSCGRSCNTRCTFKLLTFLGSPNHAHSHNHTAREQCWARMHRPCHTQLRTCIHMTSNKPRVNRSYNEAHHVRRAGQAKVTSRAQCMHADLQSWQVNHQALQHSASFSKPALPWCHYCNVRADKRMCNCFCTQAVSYSSKLCMRTECPKQDPCFHSTTKPPPKHTAYARQRANALVTGYAAQGYMM